MRKASKKLAAGEEEEHSPALYHLHQTKTLATCAEGENRFIESMCQNIFSVDDIFEVLCDPTIHAAFKEPYLGFFLWVYLSTVSFFFSFFFSSSFSSWLLQTNKQRTTKKPIEHLRCGCHGNWLRPEDLRSSLRFERPDFSHQQEKSGDLISDFPRRSC